MLGVLELRLYIILELRAPFTGNSEWLHFTELFVIIPYYNSMKTQLHHIMVNEHTLHPNMTFIEKSSKYSRVRFMTGFLDRINDVTR